MKQRGMNSVLRSSEGAVFVEQLIALLPTLFFFLATWQLLELCAADLVVKRAANAAARAAIVVLPDDPMFYGGTPVNSFTGARKYDIELSAAMILSTAPQLSADFAVEISPASGNQPLTATVTAPFHCFAGDRKSTRLNSSHIEPSRMPSSA